MQLSVPCPFGAPLALLMPTTKINRQRNHRDNAREEESRSSEPSGAGQVNVTPSALARFADLGNVFLQVAFLGMEAAFDFCNLEAASLGRALLIASLVHCSLSHGIK